MTYRKPIPVLVDGVLFKSATQAANHINVCHTRITRELSYSNSFEIMRYKVEAVNKRKDLLKKKPPQKSSGENHPCAKLNRNSVREMRKRHAQGETYADLARYYGVSETVVTRTVRRLNWKDVT